MAEFNHDLHLIREVKDALLRGTESAGIDVQVSGGAGVIRLAGVVDVLSHKRAAEEIARRIPGVRHVENDLAVADEEHHTDKHLQEAVTAALSRHPDLRDVGCRVHRGAVSLVGHVATDGNIEQAVRLVEGMPAVREVRVLRIKVGEGQKEDDADVSRAAEQRLDELGYDHRLFEVYCDAGVLFVKGFVPTGEDRSRIKKAMHAIPGCDKLEATLITDDQVAGEIH